MASFVSRALLVAREDNLPFGWVVEDGQIIPWWYSRTGYIVKWVLFLVFTTFFFGWIVGGYFHAKSRLKKGLPPLKYHAWLVSRPDRARVDPNYAYPQATYAAAYPPQNGYPMYNMPPPLVYDPNRPPVYEGPLEGSRKIDPNQARSDPVQSPPPAADYAPPAGPPPFTLR